MAFICQTDFILVFNTCKAVEFFSTPKQLTIRNERHTLVKTSLLLTLLFSILSLPNSLATKVQATPVVDLELAMDGVPDFAIVRKWVEMLQKAGFKNVRARSIKETDKPEVKTIGKGDNQLHIVTGVLAGTKIYLPNATIKYGDLDAAKAWIAKLKGDGAANLTAEKGAYGLTKEQIVKVYDELSKRVTLSTKDRPTKDVIRSISQVWKVRVGVESNARKYLFSDKPFPGELKGLTSGSAMAMALKSVGLVMYPEKPVGGEVQVMISQHQKEKEFWPTGWDLEANAGKAAPDLFNELDVEIKATEISKTLDAIAPRLKTPIMIDYGEIERRGLSLEKRVNIPAGKTFYKIIIDRALSQGGLRSELRTDEAGKVFLWITY